MTPTLKPYKNPIIPFSIKMTKNAKKILKKIHKNRKYIEDILYIIAITAIP